MKIRKKLIEVALPLEAINVASALEKQPFTRRHPRSIHLWWARRPLAAARAVIFAQMVDDPSAWPDLFPTEKKQEKERQRLFRIMEDLVLWENTTNERVLEAARNEIWQSWRRTCADNADHPRAKELFDRNKLPAFHDPFAGGGALPLEAQRLGLESYASDLNPVAVLINKAMIEIPSKFAGRPPVNPDWQKLTKEEKAVRTWQGAQGLAEDVRYYGKWMRDEAEKRIGHFYPKVEVTEEMAQERPDLKSYIGKKLTVIAWLWARTVNSPDPAFSEVKVPLASTFMLSSKSGNEAYIEPVIEGKSYHFTVKTGDAPEKAKSGTKNEGRGANFLCLLSGAPITGDYIQSEGRAGRIGVRLMAIVADGGRGRIYIPPTLEQEDIALQAEPLWKPEIEFFQQALGFRVGNYGMTKWSDLFTKRQLVVLNTLSDLAQEALSKCRHDANLSGLAGDGVTLEEGGTGSTAYSDAVAIYMGMATSRWSDLSNALCSWNHTNQNVRALFSRQAIPMTWDFVELSPFSKMGSWFSVVESSVEASESLPAIPTGYAIQADASTQNVSSGKVVSTDPPYYDNIGYADLSDFFYMWLRRALKPVFPKLYATVAVPKAEELVATPNRHGGKEKAEAFFLAGMTNAIHNLAEHAHPTFPVTIYYAFKQAETNDIDGTASTGWETFLHAVIHSGFALTGTWPIRTERESRTRGIGSNALATSVVLVCRKRDSNAPSLTRREFLNELKTELPKALTHLQHSNIAPVDLQQAAIGPGIAIYSRYSKIVNATGDTMQVKEALALINETLDYTLAEQEGDFDADTRWALTWFDQMGFVEGDYGLAEVLSKAKNTSVTGMMDAGILSSGGGKVRLLKPEELPDDWNPATDTRLTEWEIVHQLIRALSKSGETGAAELAAQLGNRADTARELAYRLYVVCERKKRAQDALAYNALVQSWPEIQRLASEKEKTPAPPQQSTMFS